jgi:hypothetical protein
MLKIHLKNNNVAKNIFTVLLIAYASFANADNYEGYKSSIEGIGLLWLNGGWVTGGDDMSIRFIFGENSEFATYCDGKNKLYIYEKSANGFVCNVKSWEEWRGYSAGSASTWETHDASDKGKILRTIELAKKDKYSDAGQSEYYVSLSNLKVDAPGIYTVSKNKLERGSWVASAPTQDELKQTQELASLHIKDVHRDKDNRYKSVMGYSNEKIKELASREKSETYTLKIKVGDSEIIIFPTLYQSGQEGDLISTVVLHEHGNYSFIGHVYGCLLSVGADIDSDGFPEIIFENCYSTESQRIKYIKVYPEIKNLISYDHS